MAHAADLIRDGIVELLPRLRRFARSLSRNPHDADDLVQLAVERALLRADQWQPGTRLEAWMYSIVKNAWIDEYRARGRRAALFAPPEAAEAVPAPQDDTDTGLSVEQALQRLSEEQRLAVALVLIEGLSYKEAASIMEVPIGTLTSRLARAREALMATLSEENPA
jgi:RNA polymerase sigma-70 factor (ECF subfamily)